MMKRFQRILAVFLVVCTLFLACALPAFADDPEELYDVTTSGVYDDFEYLFDPKIDTTQYSTSSKFIGATNYIDLVAFYSDAVFAAWQNGAPGSSLEYVSGADYLYVYNSIGQTSVDGSLVYYENNGTEASLHLIAVSKTRFFTKFKLEHSVRVFDELSNSAYLPVKKINLTYLNRSFSSYEFRGSEDGEDYKINFLYSNQTDFEPVKISFDGQAVIDIHIDYTYWRSANFSPKGDGWHYQVDSIYFAIPNSIQDRLVDVELSYQQATTKPIVVTKTGDAVSEQFHNIAIDPNNVIPSSYYDSSKPSFVINLGIAAPGGAPCDYKYNHGGVPRTLDGNLKSIYWAFDVSDPSDISSGNLNSGELSHWNSTVRADELEDWMLNYPLTGATTTYTAANREGTGTQQVNGILFSNVQERVTKNASNIAGTSLPSYGDDHNFFQNAYYVGWEYAWAYLTGAAHQDEDGNEISIATIEKFIHPLTSSNDVYGHSDDLYFSTCQVSDLVNFVYASNHNSETAYLVNFNVSDYYAHSFTNDTSFDGYLSIQDVYLDLHVLRLFFENAQGEVYPLNVRSNGINAIGDVTHTPEEEQINEASTEALKNWLANETRPFWERLWDILRKVITVILVLFAVVIFLRILLWILLLRRQKKQQQQNTGQDQSQRRERPRRQNRPYRERRRSDRRWKR